MKIKNKKAIIRSSIGAGIVSASYAAINAKELVWPAITGALGGLMVTTTLVNILEEKIILKLKTNREYISNEEEIVVNKVIKNSVDFACGVACFCVGSAGFLISGESYHLITDSIYTATAITGVAKLITTGFHQLNFDEKKIYSDYKNNKCLKK